MPEFEQRPRGRGIIYVATCQPSRLLADFPLEDSRDVVLHCESKTVTVRDIQKQPDGIFKGRVLGVEPVGVEIQDLKEGDVVAFSEDQVISASRED